MNKIKETRKLITTVGVEFKNKLYIRQSIYTSKIDHMSVGVTKSENILTVKWIDDNYLTLGYNKQVSAKKSRELELIYQSL